MKLTKKGNNYKINSKKEFKGNPIPKNIIEKSFDFAYKMVYGEGFHRKNRSGGNKNRPESEIFFNTLQGKISEFILYELFTTKGFECSEVDTSISGKGKWDDVDLIVNSKKINIKSVAFFSNLLLLETKDWDNEGNYIPNSESYDYFILVRIQPNTNSMYNSIEGLNKDEILNLLISKKWFYDIPGCFSKKTLIHLIENNYVLPQNAKLNGSTEMDAENYYMQAGDLKELNFLFTRL